ncbi:hypothetical protein PMAYCL1PPCAC_19106, partial [Pristionchus mayeri]
VAIILGTLAVAAYCAPSASSSPASTTAKPVAEGGVKEGAADGHRRHRGWGGYGYSNPIIDRNVCDLDASVLVVVSGGRRGYNKARRVKCADIAAADEDSCTVCCQNAARRDTSIRNEDIYGFLTVIDHFEKDSRESWSRESHSDDYNRRPKRQAETENDDTEGTVDAGEAGENADYGRKKGDRKEELENFEGIQNYKNLKCLCCAPRRQLPPRPVINVPVPVPVYDQYPQYPQPVAAAAPQYAAAAAPAQYQPAQAQPTYQAQAPTNYQVQPSYQAPAAAPAQYQPAQAQPSYQAAAAPVQNY